MHRETDSHTFYQGLLYVKQKAEGTTEQDTFTKKSLVINNYVQFLAAKQTLDDINTKFLSSRENSQFLDELEEQMKQLRTKSQVKLMPLLNTLD